MSYARRLRCFAIVSLVLSVIVLNILRSGFVSEASTETLALVPVISASKSVAVVVGNADANADPGETLEYTVTINNTGPDPATGVAITDTLQNITTFVSGTTIASPIAVNDTYQSIGNVGISVPDGASDLLANDLDANNPGVNAALVFVGTVPTASANGGVVAVNTATGAFTYNPPVGFEGTDTFVYTLGNGTGLTNTATVSITVSGMIWFVQNGAAACTTIAAGCGRLGSPFSTLASFNTTNVGGGSNPDNNDNIFIYENASAYSGAVVLRSGQKLIGQDAAAALGGAGSVTGINPIPSFSNVLPTMNSGNGVFTNLTGTVTINTNATVRGLRINSTTATGITDPAGAITGVSVSEVSVTTTTGTAILFSDVTGTVSLISVSANGAANGIKLTNTSGSFAVTGTGTAGSGGTIQNTVGADGTENGNGVFMNNAASVSLSRMIVSNHPNHAIRRIGGSGFTLANSTVGGANGSNVAFDEGSVSMLNNLGTIAITSCDISGGVEDTMLLRYDSTATGTATYNVTGTNFHDNNVTTGNSGVQLFTDPASTAAVTFNFTGSQFNTNRGDGLLATFNGTAQHNLTVNTSQFNNNGQALDIASDFSADFTFSIRNNTCLFHAGATIALGTGTNATAQSFVTGSISNNVIGNNTIDSGSSGSRGILLDMRGAEVGQITIDSNTVSHTDIEGLFLDTRIGSGSLQLQVTNNVINTPDDNSPFPFGQVHGLVVTGRDNRTLCLDMRGNNSANIAGFDIRTRQSNAAVFRLEGFAGTGTSAPSVEAFYAAQNPGNSANVQTGGTGTVVNYTTSAGCTTPPPFAPDDMRTESEEKVVSLDQRDDSTPEKADRNTVPLERFSLASIGKAAGQIFYSLSNAISPSAFSQTKSDALAPESGEIVTKTLGTIPSNESVVVVFRATVDNGPYASGVNNITNAATIAGSNFANVSTNTTSIALDAAPDLSVTKTDGGGTTQPGMAVVYTLNYSNITSVNGQNAVGVLLSETVPTNATFNAASSLPSVWSCPNGSVGGTVCTLNVGAVNAGAGGSATFGINVLAALPAGVLQISNSSTVAESPNTNGTDPISANNTGSDTTNIIGNWLGATNTDWNVAANWSNGVVPPVGNNVSIPTSGNIPTVTSVDVTLNNLVLNGQNASIGAGRTITVNSSVVLGANTVSGLGTLSLAAAASISRTTGQVNSTLQKNFGGTGAFTFPVGTTGQYSPVDVNVTAGSGQLTVRANTGLAPATPTPLNAATTLQRYWTLNGSGITSDITFNYLQTDVAGNEAAYNIIRVPNAGSPVTRFVPNGTTRILNTTANFFGLSGVQVYSHWTVGEPLAPTASNVVVSGRVRDRDGRGVPNGRVTMISQDGNLVYATTNPFGYYRFVSVQAGQSYVVSVGSKRHVFASRVVSVGEDVADLDFIAEPEE